MKNDQVVSVYEKSTAVIRWVDEFCRDNLKSYFIVAFGSYAANRMTQDSDIDLIVFSKNPEPFLCKTLALEFINQCSTLGISTQAQIPHELYIISPYKTLIEGICGEGFDIDEGKLVIPQRIEHPDFYCSQKMLRRFCFNALTTHNLFCGGNNDTFIYFRTTAFCALVRFLINLTGNLTFTSKDLVKASISEPKSGRREGRFLGYKDLPENHVSLCEGFDHALTLLLSNKIIQYHDGFFVIKDQEWVKEWYSYPNFIISPTEVS
ncbi:nucleotidyltransferase domain-containing protein [Microcoleus sp. S13_B4]|uniref:nucleotidyltransferase domain-containing protein n=1 Tax=Microcoleus sp. S13_B4 TaxID=3055408 RepID=UPI002FD59CA8